MLLRRGDGLLGEGKKKRRAFVPGFPLIHVIRTEEIAALPGDCVQRRLIEIGEIGGVTLGGAEGAVHLFDGETAPGLIVQAGTGPSADERKTAQDRVIDVDGSEFPPSPLR